MKFLNHSHPKWDGIRTGNSEHDAYLLNDKEFQVQPVLPSLEKHSHLGGNIKGVNIFKSGDHEVVVPGDPLSWNPIIWQKMIIKHNIKSVLDVGSGLGYSSAWFKLLGLEVIAIDGLPYNVKNAVYPTTQLQFH